MTRINVVPVTELTDKHLLAEYRELPRVFKASRKWYERMGHNPDAVSLLPSTYRLGKGHVKFFYDKLKWLTTRWEDLYFECERRGFNVKLRPTSKFVQCHHTLWNDYTPTPHAIYENRKRISQRLNEAKGRKKRASS